MCSGPWPHFLFIQPVQLHKAAWLLPVLSSKFCEIKARKVLVAQLCPTPCEPMDYSPPGSSVHGILQERILEWVAIPFSRVSHQSKEHSQNKKKQKNLSVTFESESESRSVVSRSLRPHGLYSPWNSPGQNTGGGSPSLLQGIFPTRESNPGLPHSRRILNQLSHQGSPQLGACKYLRIASLVAQW